MDEIGSGSGNVAGTGLRVNLDPGDKHDVLLHVGTAGRSPSVGYAVPPGHYLVKARLPIYDRTEQTVTQRLVPTPLTGITLLPHKTEDAAGSDPGQTKPL